VAPAGRYAGERGAGRDSQEAVLRVELVEEPVEVALVGAPAVVQDQRPLGLPLRFPDQMDHFEPLLRHPSRRPFASG
jgi:hypothetical protein